MSVSLRWSICCPSNQKNMYVWAFDGRCHPRHGYEHPPASQTDLVHFIKLWSQTRVALFYSFQNICAARDLHRNHRANDACTLEAIAQQCFASLAMYGTHNRTSCASCRCFKGPAILERFWWWLVGRECLTEIGTDAEAEESFAVWSSTAAGSGILRWMTDWADTSAKPPRAPGMAPRNHAGVDVCSSWDFARSKVQKRTPARYAIGGAR